MNIPFATIKDWSVTYSPYVDTLHIYKSLLNKVPKKELTDKDYGDFYIVYRNEDSQVLLFEMKQASRSFGDIDNMDKKHIIQRVKELVKNYG